MNSPQSTPHAPPRKPGVPTWLVVLLSVVGGLVIVLPIVSVLGIYGVRKYIANAKQAEARSTVAEIARRAVEAHAKTGRLCASASASVPSDVKLVTGVKYMSSESDWTQDASVNGGFACLQFVMGNPQYYTYDYKATATSFTASATGDLDGDGVTSRFELSGTIDSSGAMQVAPTLHEVQPDE